MADKGPHMPQDEEKQSVSQQDTSHPPDKPPRSQPPPEETLPPDKGGPGASVSPSTEYAAMSGTPPKQGKTTAPEDAATRLPAVEPFPPMNEQLRPVSSVYLDTKKACPLLYSSLVVNDERRSRAAAAGKKLLLATPRTSKRQDPPTRKPPHTAQGTVRPQPIPGTSAPPSKASGGTTNPLFPPALRARHTTPRLEDFVPPLPTEGHEKYLSDLLRNPRPPILPERDGFRYHRTISLLDDAKHGGESNLFRCVSCGEMQRISPLQGCKKGHLTCPICRGSTSACAICKDKEFSFPFNKLELERYTRRHTPDKLWPCRFRSVGCLKEFNDSEMDWHVACCGHRATTCPAKCNWKGHLVALPEHIASGFCADIVPLFEPMNCFFGFFRDQPQRSVLVDHRRFVWTQQYLISEEHADLHLTVKFSYHNGIGEVTVSADVPSWSLEYESIMVRLVLFPANTRICPWAVNKNAPVEHFIRHSAPGVRTELFDPPLTTNTTVPVLETDFEARIKRGRQTEAHYLHRLERYRAAHPGTGPPGQHISQPRIPSKAQSDGMQAAEGLLAISGGHHGPAPSTAAQDKTPTPTPSERRDPTDLSGGANGSPRTSRPPPGGAFGKASVGMGQLMHAELMSSSHRTYSASGPPSSRSLGEPCYDPKAVRLPIDQTMLKGLSSKGILYCYSIQCFRSAKPF